MTTLIARGHLLSCDNANKSEKRNRQMDALTNFELKMVLKTIETTKI